MSRWSCVCGGGVRRGVAVGMLVVGMSWPAVAWAGEAAQAEEDGLVTDRPDVAESSQTVAPWRVQLEAGVDVARTFGLTQTLTLSAPTKLRVGVARMAELHLESDVVQVQRASGQGQQTTEASGMALDVGGKVHLLDERGAVPSLGVLAAVTLPTGGALAQSGVGATAKVAADWTLTELVGLGVNLGLTSPITERAQEATTLVWASSFGFGLTDDLGMFMELFGESPLHGRGGAAWSLSMDGGCTLKLSPDLQLDAYVRAEQLNRRAALGGGLGVSVRI